MTLLGGWLEQAIWTFLDRILDPTVNLFKNCFLQFDVETHKNVPLLSLFFFKRQ